MSASALPTEPTTVSVDVWDTLLRRRCAPDAVKLFTCQTLRLLAGARLKPWCRDAWTLLALRRRIERRLARQSIAGGGDGEYRIADVLAELVACAVGVPGPAGPLADRLLAIEIAQERFVTYADPGIGHLLATLPQSARLLFVSDFYMPRQTIAALLSTHGFAALAANGVVSGDIGLNKRSGRLFAQIARERAIDPRTWLHIGDDARADVRAPAALGLQTRLYCPIAEDSRRAELRRDFLRPQQANRKIATDARAELGRSGRAEAFHLAHTLAAYVWSVRELVAGGRVRRVMCTGGQARLIDGLLGAFDEVVADIWPSAPRTIVRDPREVARLGEADAALVVGCDVEPGGRSFTLQRYLGRDWRPADAPRLAPLLDGAHDDILPIARRLARDWRTHALGDRDIAPEARASWRAALDGRVAASPRWPRPHVAPQLAQVADRLNAVYHRLALSWPNFKTTRGGT